MIKKLILLVSQHRQFGWKLSIHIAEDLAGEGLLLKGIPSALDEKEKGRPDIEIQLIDTVNKSSDEVLLKSYSSEKDKFKITQSAIDNLIRPGIEKTACIIIDLALKANIPVYVRDDIKSKSLSAYNRLDIFPKPSQCIFNFIKDETGINYFISLTNEGKEISLQQSRTVILSDNPCLVVLGNSIQRVENIEAKKLAPFFSKESIRVPSSSEKEYIKKFVIKTISRNEVNICGIEMKEIFPEKHAILSLEEDFNRQMCFTLCFKYGQELIRPFHTRKKIVSVSDSEGKQGIVWFNRDEKWESSLLTILQNLNLKRVGENQFYLQFGENNGDSYGLVQWMNKHLPELSDFVVEQKTDITFYHGTVEISSAIDEKIDWFDLNIEVVLDNCRIAFNRFRKHILSGNSEFVLPDGRIFILPQEWFVQYHHFFLCSENGNETIRLKKLYTSVLHETMDSLSLNDKKGEIAEFLKTPVEQPDPGIFLDKILRPYQKKGFYWLNHLRNLKFGGCLADDMGLGKTLQTITLLNYVYKNGIKKENSLSLDSQFSLFSEILLTVSASLVVVPTSLLHNWQKELKKFAPDLKVYVHAGTKRVKSRDIGQIFNYYQIIITSYGTLRMDIDYLNKYLYEYIILDESQSIKNPDSVVYRAVQTLKAHHRLVLTGTPIENSLVDLWTQFSFINPGLLGSLNSFRENFVNKIVKERNPHTEKSLRRLIKPFILRRTKEEVAPDLPLLTQDVVYCDMTEAQERIYNEYKNTIRNQLLADTGLFLKNKFIALQSLMKLRLLANHPVLTKPDYAEDAGKFEQILMYFEGVKAGGHKVLIFSSFVKHLQLLSRVFDEKGWKYSFLTGQTHDREKEINKFNHEKEVSCFFISLKAGGTGLNLTAADYVFIIDPWWNPATEMQAMSRAHRIGQEKNVMVYRFISGNTIEEKIMQLQEAKSKLSETFIATRNPFEMLNSSDLEKLFD